MFTIMVVEDSQGWRMAYQAVVPDDIKFVEAASLGSARELFLKHLGEIDMIIMDGDLGGGIGLETVGLVAMMRERDFTGPIIAASSDPDYRRQLLEAGCDQEYEKHWLADALPGLIRHMQRNRPTQ